MLQVPFCLPHCLTYHGFLCVNTEMSLDFGVFVETRAGPGLRLRVSLITSHRNRLHPVLLLELSLVSILAFN